jgi:hypothetical protein
MERGLQFMLKVNTAQRMNYPNKGWIIVKLEIEIKFGEPSASNRFSIHGD